MAVTFRDGRSKGAAMTSQVFPREEYEARWAKVQGEMARRGYETAVIWSRGASSYDRCANLLWLVNHYSGHPGQTPDNNLWQGRGHNAVIMRAGREPELHNDELLEPADWLATDNWHWHQNPIKGTAEALNEQGITGPVAIVGTDFLPCKYMDWLREWCPRIDWRPEDDLVKSVQHVKSPRELDVFREAGDIASRALTLIMEGLVSGQTEAEAASAGAAEVVRRGGIPAIIRLSHGTGDEMNNFSRYPLSGADPDSAPVDGDFVRAWIMGPMRHGYFLDPGRTAVCGRRPSNTQRALMEACMGIVDGVMEKIRPGVSPHELAREGDRLTREAGGGDTVDQAGLQWPLYGHLCDMMFENPMYGLSTCDEDQLIQESMVCSSEAFLAWEGVGAVGFEQNLIVGKDGVEVITTTPVYWE